MWATYDADFDESDARGDGHPKGEQVREVGIDPDCVQQVEEGARRDGDAQLGEHVKHAASVAGVVLRARAPDPHTIASATISPESANPPVAGAPPLA